jgi:hypothetical protein
VDNVPIDRSVQNDPRSLKRVRPSKVIFSLSERGSIHRVTPKRTPFCVPTVVCPSQIILQFILLHHRLIGQAEGMLEIGQAHHQPRRLRGSSERTMEAAELLVEAVPVDEGSQPEQPLALIEDLVETAAVEIAGARHRRLGSHGNTPALSGSLPRNRHFTMLRDDEESFCPNKLWVIQGRLLMLPLTTRCRALLRPLSHNRLVRESDRQASALAPACIISGIVRLLVPLLRNVLPASGIGRERHGGDLCSEAEQASTLSCPGYQLAHPCNQAAPSYTSMGFARPQTFPKIRSACANSHEVCW